MLILQQCKTLVSWRQKAAERFSKEPQMITTNTTNCKLQQTGDRALLLAALIFGLFLTIPAGQAAAEILTEFEGLIEPYEMVNVGTPVEGVIEHVEVQRSAFVQKGDPLVRLESSVERAVVERSQALISFEGEIKLQEERLAFAQRIHARIEELFKSEAISAEKKDEAATNVTLARASLQKAQESKMLAQIDLKHAQAILDQRTINSPISGIVVERFVSPGEFIDNQPLLRLVQLDPLRVEVVLPAEMFRDIKPGMEANVTPELPADGSYKATVTIVDRVIDPASGTFGVRLELPNPDYQLPGGLKCTVHFADVTKTDSPADTVAPMEADKVAKGSGQEPYLTTGIQ